MSRITKALQASCAAVLLSGGPALAQEACNSYVIEAGDNLRQIARRAYGDPDLYRVIYEANVPRIGAKADLIEVGIRLDIPCDPNAPAPASAEVAPEAAVQPTEVAAAPPASQVPPEPIAAAAPPPEFRPVALLTGNGYAPFTDETLPGGGMFTQLVEMAVFRADPSIAYNLTFINDWQAHIDALLPAKAYDLSFPWSRPDCEAPETLSAGDQSRCENFVFSDPFYEIVEAFFSRTDSGLSQVTHYEDFAGRRICRPEGYTTGVLDAAGLTVPAIDLVRPAELEDCFSDLMQGKVDLVAIDAEVGDAALARMGLTGSVEQNPHLTTLQSLHVIAHKSNEPAVRMLGLLNEGIIEMYESGEWYDIVSAALAQNQLQQ
jgi:polar amino acid transport system substrate-binding protein